MRKTLLFIVALLVFGLIAFFVKADEINHALQRFHLPETEITIEDVRQSQPSYSIPSDSEKEEKEFEGINLAVPFSPQAPFADWSLPFAEACEETSALLVDHFYRNAEITPEIANEEILALVEWEKENLGHYEHTNMEETARILREYFGYEKVELSYDISINDLKNKIKEGYPVIVPLAGRQLGNPYYTPPGPIYHVLVVKGITKNGDFITNDVGTRRGQNFIYDADVLFDAIHDVCKNAEYLSDADLENKMLEGAKAMIVVYPNSDPAEN
ncbi:MAG: C39 family peptidase [Candidatus Peribacteraceae bacterium]|nr:C39 family peptidase [Candidatus Peribacteraceae bacterium]